MLLINSDVLLLLLILFLNSMYKVIVCHQYTNSIGMLKIEKNDISCIIFISIDMVTQLIFYPVQLKVLIQAIDNKDL